MENEHVHVLRSVATALGSIGKPTAGSALPLLHQLARIPRVQATAEWAIKRLE